MAITTQQQEALKARGFSTVQVGGKRNEPARIAYKVHGKGSDKIILVAGLMSRGNQWEKQIQHFQPNFQVLVFDNRGVGESSESDVSRYTTQQDAYEVLNHLKWDKYHIIGQSMGGMIAQELALLDLSRVQSLSLLATHAGSFRSLPPPFCAYMMIKNLFVRDVKEQAANSLLLGFGNSVHSNKARYDEFHTQIVKLKSTYGDSPLSSFLKQLTAVFGHRVSADRLRLIKDANIPALVITGTDDLIIRPSNSTEIASALGIKPIVLQHIGHDLKNEGAEQVNTLLERHVRTAFSITSN